MKEIKPSENMIADSMYHLSAESGSSVEYGKASLVGFVGGLMAMGMTFEQAIKVCVHKMPKDTRMECIPDSWQRYCR